jgi:hemoglobin
MRDIESRQDIYYLMECFYARAIPDAMIGYFFTDIAKLDLPTHLPVITDFWEMVVFGGKQYSKNVMAVHTHLHQLSAMEEKHFTRWLELFTATLSSLFAGERAELVRQRAISIATIMKTKILYSSPINKKDHDH